MIRICLDKTLKKLGISRYELAKRTGIQYQIIDNYYKNKVVRYDSYILDKVCTALGCGICDIIEYKNYVRVFRVKRLFYFLMNFKN